MLSPPMLTGEMPANTLTDSRFEASKYEVGGSMWLPQAEIKSTPSTLTLIRSSAKPRIIGRLDTPPLAAVSTPVKKFNKDAVSSTNCVCLCKLDDSVIPSRSRDLG